MRKQLIAVLSSLLCILLLSCLAYLPLLYKNHFLISIAPFSSDFPYEMIRENLYVEHVVGYSALHDQTISTSYRSISTNVYVVSGDVGEVFSYGKLLCGRTLLTSDRNGVLLEKDQAIQLFGSYQCIGEEVTMGSAKYTILGVYEKNKDLLSFLSSPISTCAFISADSFPIDKIAICFAENVSPSLAAALVQDISLSAEIRLVALENLAMKANIAVFMASLLLLVSILNFSFAYKRCIEKQIAKNKQIVKETFSSKYLREAFFRAFPYIVYLFLEYLPIVLSLFGGIYNLLYHLTYDPSLFPTSITQENLIMAIKNNINHLNISRSLVCLPVMYLQWNNRLALLVCFVSCIMSRVIKGENGNEKKHSFK